MNKAFFIFFFLLAGNLSSAQENRQFMLKPGVRLNSYIDSPFNRVEITSEELTIVDSLISIYINENHSLYSWTDKINGYHEYYRQYAGFKNSMQEKIVFVNASKTRNKYFSEEEMGEILDDCKGGGNYHFKIKVNMSKNQCFELRVNAPK